jgi:putative nucleotidyltransferase with HDIG domain
MGLLEKESFFSVSFDLIVLDLALPYDLYINSSTHVTREKFVRIYPSGARLSKEDLLDFKRKYHQLYILETQRQLYLKNLVDCRSASDIQKTSVIRDSAIVYLNKVFTPDKEFTTQVLGEAIEGCRDSVESMVDTLKDYSVEDVSELIGSLSFHDFYTYDHSINVSMYSISIFKAIKPKASREEQVMAGLGGLLHDLGKIKIPTQIINNPGKLSEEDFEEIKKHPDYGVELLDQTHIDCPGVNFDVIRRIIHEHHENYNGTGYPNKIAAKDIHLMARICAVADFFDAITTKRSYHDVLSVDEALKVMSRASGRKIDPKVFDIFVKSIRKNGLTEKSNRELRDDFDPCQPHNVLPFAPIDNKKKLSTEQDKNFGKVSGDSDIFGKKERQEKAAKDKKKAG